MTLPPSIDPPAARQHFYFPNPPRGDAAGEAGEIGADLQPEIALVRVVLRRLAAYLDAAAESLPPDEVRRLSGLIFTGARTVAHLLGQRAAQPDELRHWLDGALDAIAADRHIDL